MKLSDTSKAMSQCHYMNGKAYPLLCTVATFKNPKTNEEERRWYYHSSEDAGQDGMFVCLGINDIKDDVAKEFVGTGKTIEGVCVRSDNCKEQFKSKHTIHGWTKLSLKMNIPILWSWGIPGHGKNEVDSAGGVYKNTLLNPIKRGLLNLNRARNAAVYHTTRPSTILMRTFMLPPQKYKELVKVKKQTKTRLHNSVSV